MADTSAPAAPATGAPATPSAPVSPEQAAPAPAPSTDLPGRDTTHENDTPQEGQNDFVGLGLDVDDDLVEVKLPEANEAGAEAPVVDDAQKLATAAAEAAAAQAQKPPQQPAQPAAPAPQTDAASSPSVEPKAFLQQLAENREGIMEELAKSFDFTPEEKAKLAGDLDVDATKTIIDNLPKLKAQVFYAATTAALQHMERMVPVMVQRTVQQLRKHDEAEKQFFTQFPSLSKDKHWNDVVAFSNSFKRTNPNMTQADLFAMVGSAIMAKHGLQAAAAPRGGQNPQRVPTPPFVPAQNGSGVNIQTQPESDPWAGMGLDHDD